MVQVWLDEGGGQVVGKRGRERKGDIKRKKK